MLFFFTNSVFILIKISITPIVVIGIIKLIIIISVGCNEKENIPS